MVNLNTTELPTLQMKKGERGDRGLPGLRDIHVDTARTVYSGEHIFTYKIQACKLYHMSKKS